MFQESYHRYVELPGLPRGIDEFTQLADGCYIIEFGERKCRKKGANGRLCGVR